MAFDARVSYASATALIDRETGELKAKAVAIETNGVYSLRTAAAEMQAVAAQNTKLRSPADMHYVLSWREGEIPTVEQAFAAGRHALGAIGLDQHQYVMALHADTDNRHLHIIVNRVHPQTFRAVDLYRDYGKLHLACREMELVQGWSPERGIHNLIDGVIEKAEPMKLDSAALTGRAPDMQAWSDERPFTEWVKIAANDLRAILELESRSWAMVHARFAELGLRFERKGSGLIVVDLKDRNRVAKASHIGRFASKANLEAMLGPFERDAFGAQHDPRTAEITDASTGAVYDARNETRSEAVAPDKPDKFDDRRANGVQSRDQFHRLETRYTDSATRNKSVHREYRSTHHIHKSVKSRLTAQRESEIVRDRAISLGRRELRLKLASSVGDVAAASLAAAWAVDQRRILREEIIRERALLTESLPLRRALSWRSFLDIAQGKRQRQKTDRTIRRQGRLTLKARSWFATQKTEDPMTDTASPRYNVNDPTAPYIEPEAANRESITNDRDDVDEAVKSKRPLNEPSNEKPARKVANPSLIATVNADGTVTYRLPGIANRVMNRNLFVDSGSRIVVLDTSTASIRRALAHANEKWGGAPLIITAESSLRGQMEKEAAKMGISIVGSKRHSVTLEKGSEQKDAGSQTKPQSVSRNPRKSPAHGLSR